MAARFEYVASKKAEGIVRQPCGRVSEDLTHMVMVEITVSTGQGRAGGRRQAPSQWRAGLKKSQGIKLEILLEKAVVKFKRI